MRDRRLHDLPRAGRGTTARPACSDGAVTSGVLELRVHDLRAAASDPHRSVDDAPFGGGPGMVLMREPLFAAVEAAEPTTACRARFCCSARAGGGSTRRWREELAVDRRASRSCAVATRASTSGSPTTWSTGSSRSATSCWPAERLPPWWSSRRWLRLVPGVLGNATPPAEESFADGPARVPPVHEAGRVPGLGGARRAALGRPRGGRPVAAGPGARRTLGTRPDLIEARGGLSADEVALLRRPARGACSPDHGYHG